MTTKDYEFIDNKYNLTYAKIMLYSHMCIGYFEKIVSKSTNLSVKKVNWY